MTSDNIAVYGIPGLTVLETLYMLKLADVTHGVVSTTFTKIPGKLTLESTPVVFPSMSRFISTKQKFKVPITALVVDNPYVLSDSYKVPLLGAQVTNFTVKYSSFSKDTLLSTLKEPEQFTGSFTPDSLDYSKQILKKFRGSSLGGLQTMQYKVKDKDTRALVNTVVKNYFIRGLSLATTKEKLTQLVPGPVAESFLSLLSTEGCCNLKDAIQEVQRHPTKIDRIATKYKVSPFDIKYMLASK